VLVTSVKPFQLMIGKIIGIGAVGLTQFLLWGILTFGINLLLPLFMGDKMLAMQTLQQSNQLANASESTQLLMNISNAFQDLSIGRMLFSFVFYFMFGYLFYASQFAAIGAAMTDDSDAQSFTFPVTIPIIISMVLMSVTLQQPFSGAAFWGSMLPFSSPIIMITRIPFQVPWWEQLLSMFILFISSLGMVYIAAKIYRVGILIQGKKITFKEIGKWIFY
jgi:ABC-2 type transport system permease protein